MIGLDAADMLYINEYLDHLPNLKRLKGEGTTFSLGTTSQMMDGSVWPSFYTKSLPADHGIFFPMQFDPKTMHMYRLTPQSLPCDPFWNGLARNGIPVSLLDIPMMFPEEGVDNLTEVNWNTQENFNEFHTSAPELAREIKRRFGPSPLGFDIPADKTCHQLSKMRDDLIASIRKRGALARWQMENTPWQLFIAGFSEIHRGGHNLAPDPDAHISANIPDNALREIYQAADDAVGTMLAGLDMDNTTVIVFAVHGMGPNNSQAHFVPEILDRVNARFLGHVNGAVQKTKSNHGLMHSLREKVPAQIQLGIARQVPQSVRDWVVDHQFCGGVDWREAPGFQMLSGGQGFIRFNLKGREAEGLLEPGGAEYQRYLAMLKDCFASLKLPGSDTTVMSEITMMDEYCQGPRRDELPDMIVTWKEMPPVDEVVSDEYGSFTGHIGTGRGGNHKPRAFAMVSRSGLDRAQSPEPDHITNLATYVEGLLGAPGTA